MNEVRVIITYNDEDKLESITVDNEEMDIECASEFTVTELFQKHTGRNGWRGLEEEVKELDDSDSIFAEFKGSDALKEEFRKCCKEYGLNWSIDSISSEVLIEKNQREASKQRTLGNEEKAFELEKEAADKGSSEMKRNIADRYYQASQGNISLDMTDAESELEAYELAKVYYGMAAGNNIDALFALYELLEKHDDEDQFVWLKKAADNGHVEAMKLFASYYRESDTDEDNKKAFHYYELAAQNNDPDSLYILGQYYSQGIGTDESNEKAFDCYNKAANLGHIKSQCKVADCFCSGCGTEKDISKALEMYRKAAENDNTYAQYKLGEIYYYGDEGYKDETKGLEWFQLVAKKDWSLDDQEKIEEAAIVLGIEYFENNDVSTAINWLLKASENDNSDAQYLLGYVYGDLDDYQNAVTWYLKAANAGHKIAQFEMGQCYFKGMGVSEDFSIAAHWFEESINNQSICRFDYPEGTDIQLLIGCCYFLLQSFDQSREWLTRSANQGNNIAVYYLGQIEKEEGNLTESFNLFTRAAENGDADAQYELGDCYYYGKGTDEDESMAVKWFTKAAKNGNIEAQYELGICYQNGRGVDVDEDLALKWYKQAAENNQPDAQYKLGRCYFEGDCVEADKAKAINWFSKSAENGNVYAQRQLAWCYYNGDGVDKDQSMAVKYFTQAAENGDSISQYELGECYFLGHGVSENNSEALKWYTKASEDGDCNALYRIAECNYKGFGTAKNYKRAFEILNNLVNDEYLGTYLGHYCNIYMLLGRCYENGNGTSQDFAAAIQTYKVIADGDYDRTAEACYRIGYIYRDHFMDTGKILRNVSTIAAAAAIPITNLVTVPAAIIGSLTYNAGKKIEFLKTDNGQEMLHYFEKAADLGYEEAKKALKKLESYK